MVKKPPENSSSTPHHCEIKSSRLPTLPEEETPDLRIPGPVTVVKEEASGKDDTVEVNLKNTRTALIYTGILGILICIAAHDQNAFSPSFSRTW